jgi:hypothetical protein
MAPPKSHAGQSQSGTKPLFGPAPESAPGIAARPGPAAGTYARKPGLAAQITERLQEKYHSYERAALRLELRGEHDAATLLRAAAGRARILKNAAPQKAPVSAAPLFPDTKA